MIRVGVLFGALGGESAVASASAASVLRALRQRGHAAVAYDLMSGFVSRDEEAKVLLDVVPVAPPPAADNVDLAQVLHLLLENRDQLRAMQANYLGLHGGLGEDGTLQTILALLEIPFTGTGRVGSTLAMDKDLSKAVMRGHGVETPDWRIVSPGRGSRDATQLDIPLPVVVKPNSGGSSLATAIVRVRDQLEPAIAAAAQLDPYVLLEAYVPGREFVVGIVGGGAVAVGEVRPRGSEVFDYRNKYQPGAALELFPAPIGEGLREALQARALVVHERLRLGYYSRVDFRVDAQGGIWCLEANTLPGMTRTSLLPQGAAAVGLDFASLCERICSGSSSPG